MLADWIALDWAPGCVMAWAMNGTTVLDHRTHATETGQDVPVVLRDLFADWDCSKASALVACGALPGSSERLQSVPCKPGTTIAEVPPLPGFEIKIFAVPGLRQETPTDAVWGPETKISGFLSLNPGWDGVICVPGETTCWALVSAGEIVSFQTFMTGALTDVLGQTDAFVSRWAEADWNTQDFDAGLTETLSRPDRLAAKLSELRALILLDQPPVSPRAYLTGLLVGAELAAARPYWLGQQLAVIGDTTDAAPYVAALEAQGAPVTRSNAKRATLAGLTAAWRMLS
ncbi:2-dehydro-3-deoxygalactonokinase [Arenibacterium sp. CAU 1754]